MNVPITAAAAAQKPADAEEYLCTLFPAHAKGSIGIVKIPKHGFCTLPWAPGEDLADTTYVCISTLDGEVWVDKNGNPRPSLIKHLESSCLETWCVFCDDVGTAPPDPDGKLVSKVDPKRFAGLLPTTGKLETSLDNYQYVYAFKDPVDPTKAAALVRGMVAAGLTDPGSQCANRVMRVPGAINRKRGNFVARLVEWHPERLYTFEEVCTGLGVTPIEKTAPEPDGARDLPDGMHDPAFEWLVGRGMVLSGGPNARGGWDISCPWAHEHGPGEKQGSTNWFPGNPGGFSCLHGHCAGRTGHTLRQWILEQDPGADLSPIPREELQAIGSKLKAAVESGWKRALAERYKEAQARKGEDPAQLLAWALDAVPLSAEMLPSPKRMSNNRVSIEQVVSPARVHKVMDLIGMSVRQNVMTGDFESRFEAEGVTGFFFKEEDSGKAIGGLVHACSRCGLKGPEQIKQIVVSRARDNRFSPVGEWIKSKPWDGRSRIQELCDTLIMRNRAQIITAPAPAGGGADTSAVPPTASEDAALAALAAVNRWRDLVVPLWLKQTVAAIRNWENEVPTSVGHVLVLQGPKQGGNKSFWIEALLPAPWVSIGMSLRLDGPNERDAVSRVTSTPITELGELDHSFKRSETGALKNFLTAPKDRYRPPYATKDETKPRGTSFIATLNPEGFLVDPTGARRFWPLGVIKCVLDHGIDMQQLWAEVWALEEKNGVFWLVGEEQERMHDEITQQHAAPTEERDILDQLKYREQICNVSEYVHASVKDLWEHHTGHGRRGSMVNYVNLNAGLTAAGYRGAKVLGKRGFYVPKYTDALTAEQMAQLGKKLSVIQGGKKDE